MSESAASSGEATHVRVFTELRPLLFTIAYELLGSAADADDVLQDSYLRWADIDHSSVANPKSYLAKVVTRQALNSLRGAARRREDYVGPWLPEPIVLDDADPAEDAVLAESVSTAMLVVMESLSPDERAVFILREVFGFGHSEIADILGKNAAAVRQLAHRARAAVQARKPRFEVSDAAETARVVQEFLVAAGTGRVEDLIGLLHPDAVFTADSGGKVSAARRPVVGADRVARLLIGLSGTSIRDGMTFEPATVNGSLGFVWYLDGVVDTVMVADVRGGLIAHVYTFRNPDKLAAIGRTRTLHR